MVTACAHRIEEEEVADGAKVVGGDLGGRGGRRKGGAGGHGDVAWGARVEEGERRKEKSRNLVVHILGYFGDGWDVFVDGCEMTSIRHQPCTDHMIGAGLDTRDIDMK